MKRSTKRFIFKFIVFVAVCVALVLLAPKYVPFLKEKFGSKESVQEMANNIGKNMDKAQDAVGKNLKKAGDGIGKGIDSLRQ